jgi:putative ABC transport system substrate-binding protein
MKRRSFLTALGGAAAWPLVARAQQPTVPVIGFLSSGSPRAFARLTAAFREGLQTEGYVHGSNVWVEYRWAEGHYDDLPGLAADLVQRRVAVIAATGGLVSAEAAKKATTEIPIVFVVGPDPVHLKLVTSLNRPGGNATGVSIFTTELAIKRLELLHDMVPKMQTVAILVNPGSITTDIEVIESTTAAGKLGLKLLTIEARSETDFEPAFEMAFAQKADALLISADAFFTSRRVQLVALAARFSLPAMYPLSSYVEAGGLVSYGTELTWAYSQVGTYAGRILKGAKPGELPVVLPTDFNLVINLKTAKALGLALSPLVLTRAHRVME